MTKPIVSKQCQDQAWIPPEPLHHVTIIQLKATASTHSVRVPMWQTRSVWPVRTAHISVLQTVNTESHNPAQSCSDNIQSWPPDNHHNSDVVLRRGGEFFETRCITIMYRTHYFHSLITRHNDMFHRNVTATTFSCYSVSCYRIQIQILISSISLCMV